MSFVIRIDYLLQHYLNLINNPELARVWFILIQIAVFAAVSPGIGLYVLWMVKVKVIALHLAPAEVRPLWVDFLETKCWLVFLGEGPS